MYDINSSDDYEIKLKQVIQSKVKTSNATKLKEFHNEKRDQDKQQVMDNLAATQLMAKEKVDAAETILNKAKYVGLNFSEYWQLESIT